MDAGQVYVGEMGSEYALCPKAVIPAEFMAFVMGHLLCTAILWHRKGFGGWSLSPRAAFLTLGNFGLLL